MDSTILNYLTEYRTKYNIDDLKKEVLSKGYSEMEFDDALNELKKQDLFMNSKNNFKYKSLGENLVSKKKKGKGFGIIFSVFIIIVLLIVILNYFDINIFGFNIFDFLK